MTIKDKLDALKNKANSEVVDEHLTGLAWMTKVYSQLGDHAAFLSESKLDLDTDGKKDPSIDSSKYDHDHQDTTSLDTTGTWLNANKISYFVLPGGFATKVAGKVPRHGGIPLGCLGTLVYKEKLAHVVFADIGPEHKFGEASINAHRVLGFERVKNHSIIDAGMDSGVYLLVYVGSQVSPLANFTQADIDHQAAALWSKFI